VLDLPANRRDRASRALRNASRVVRRVPPLIDRFSGFEQQVAEILRGRRYELGIIEHFWCAPYQEQLSAVCERTVLDLHNIESHLHYLCAAAENRTAAIAHRVFERAARKLEAHWIPRFSQVLTASKEDAKRVRAKRVTVYPNALPSCGAGCQPAADCQSACLAFSGNLEYHPNISAVRFFARDIWPRLRAQHPQLTWRLIGKNPEAVRPFITGDPRIEVTGPVDDAVAELARARVAVVPLLAGSGTRLKILEAWAAGVPVVSTTIGAEGLPVRDGEHLLLADRPEAFAAAIARLLDDPGLRARLSANARALLEREFTWEAAWRRLDF
jgi:hypothetical protein